MNREKQNYRFIVAGFTSTFLLGMCFLIFKPVDPPEKTQTYINLPDSEIKDLDQVSLNEENPEDYAISPEAVRDIEDRREQIVAMNESRFTSSSRGIASINSDDSANEVEQLYNCGEKRRFYEKQMIHSSKIKELLATNRRLESKFSKKCITHIMKKFSVSSRHFATCSRAAGAAKTPGAKPCVTNNLVNLTYNSYMDVTDCLNLDPKLLMPKIGYESGFFINTLGSELDGGLGQLTRPAIAEVNRHIDHYVAQITKAAAHKPSCKRLLKYKSFFTKVPIEASQRCSVIGLPENPLKNILYMALLNRINMDQISGVKYVAGYDFQPRSRELASTNKDGGDVEEELGGGFKNYDIKNKLIRLGIENPDMDFFKDVILITGYNTGVHTALRILRNYLNERIEKNLKLTKADFDFNNPKMAKDEVTGKTVNAVDLARSYIMSSFKSRRDSKSAKHIKAKRHRMLPHMWAKAYTKSFPEYLVYKANSYNGKSKKRYSIYGFPGYLSLVAGQNKDIRDEFKRSNLDPDLCSDPDFLKMKN